MAIQLINLLPIKNSSGVSINEDISFTLISDSSELDISSISFLINGVEVQISAYFGANKNEVEASFYARRRIRYKTRTYGQANFRYGQTDDFPSSWEYGQRYVCSITIKDVSGLSFSENFSFSIEEGVFYNGELRSYLHPQTQALANYTPEWARARYDKYSNFQQFINPSAGFLQRIEDSLFKQEADYFVQTVNLNSFSKAYKVELGKDFSFQTTVLDSGETLQIPPEISAIDGVTKFFPTSEFKNDIKSFFEEKIPTRIRGIKKKIDSLEISPRKKIENRIYNINKKLERKGRISLLIDSGTLFTVIQDNDFKFVNCRIKGISKFGEEATEDIIIIDNDTYYSSKEWYEIYSISFTNLPESSGAFFTVDHGRMLGSYIADSFSHVSVGDIDKKSFWKKEETVYGSVLQQWVLLALDPEDVISSLGEKDLIKEYELADIDGSPLSLLDVEADKYSNKLYGLDSGFLYLFDKREEYPKRLKEIGEENGDSDFVLELDSDDLSRGDSQKNVDIIGTQKYANKKLLTFRISVHRPDGSVHYLLEDGTHTLDKNEGTLRVNSKDLIFETPNISYPLDLLGEYIIKLEGTYNNGSVSTDSKIVIAPEKRAIAKYKIDKFLGTESPVRFFIDSDQKIKILDSGNWMHTLEFARDNMLIDYSNSILYFNEDYTEIEVL